MRNTIHLIVTLLLATATACTSDRAPSTPPTTTSLDSTEQQITADEIDLPSTSEEQIVEHINRELSSGRIFNQILLEHRFGMSSAQVYALLKDLTATGRMYKVPTPEGKRKYVYDMDLPELGSVRMLFDAYYVDDELYEIVTRPVLPERASPTDFVAQAHSILTADYGRADFDVPSPDSPCAQHLWVDGNRMVSLTCDDKGAEMVYTDLLRAQRADALEDPTVDYD